MAEHSGGVASLSAEFLMTTDPNHATDTCPSLVNSQGHGDPSSHVLRYALCIVGIPCSIVLHRNRNQSCAVAVKC